MSPNLRLSEELPDTITTTKTTPPHTASLLLRMAGVRLSNFIKPYLPTVDLSFFQYTILCILSSSQGESVPREHIKTMLRADDYDLAFPVLQLLDRGLLYRHSDPAPPHAVTYNRSELGELALLSIDRQVEDDLHNLSHSFTEEEWESGIAFLAKLSREVATL